MVSEREKGKGLRIPYGLANFLLLGKKAFHEGGRGKNIF